MEIFDAIANDDISGVRRIIEEQDLDLNNIFNGDGYIYSFTFFCRIGI